MDVTLFVYDLSQGLARQMSAAFIGTQIDAVYHTSLVFGGVEYFFGAGVQTAYPGSTHHGRPMEQIKLGVTQLDLETIKEYLEGLKEIYTPESYDLFMHNCNNFTNDFSQFLVGKGIPNHITSLPQTVIDTPFGQMLRPQLDRAMRGVTQAPVPPPAVPPTQGTRAPANGATGIPSNTGVHNITRLADLDRLLQSAKGSCAAIFFTSSTCAPCKTCYPAFDSLSEELGVKATLIKVDLNASPEIAMKYQVRGTPHFMTFLHGEKAEEWTGADPSKLLANIRLLFQMAHPSHPHSQLRLRLLQKVHDKPITYAKVPPLDKLIAKLGPIASEAPIVELKKFLEVRFAPQRPSADAAMPNMPVLSQFIKTSIKNVPLGNAFALVDLCRLAVVDKRISGFLIEESDHSTLSELFSYINGLKEECPYNLRLVTVQAACNLFSSPLFAPKVFRDQELAESLMSLVGASLLDEEHPAARVSAASLAFNLSASDHKIRFEGDTSKQKLDEELQVELAAVLIEAIGREESDESLRGLILALGLLVYERKQDGELKEVLNALDARSVAQTKQTGQNKELVGEVLQVL